jgi:Rrf2 family nitric oxide-sensitive transcriptional repressor
MQLTTFTDYALRVLISVGVKGEHELSTISEISKQYGISKNHLIKVVHHLSKTGYLATSQGKGGGFRLAKHPSKIRVGDVIRDAERHFDLVPCFSSRKKGDCAIEPACVLKRALREAVKAFLAVTDDYTLADLLRPRNRLQTLLAVNA